MTAIRFWAREDLIAEINRLASLTEDQQTKLDDTEGRLKAVSAAAHSLLNDVYELAGENDEAEDMRCWFGPFSASQDHGDGPSVEWPNLRIAADELQETLKGGEFPAKPSPNRVILTMEGGVIQGVVANRPDDLDMVVVAFEDDDFDSGHRHAYEIDGEHAYVYRYPADAVTEHQSRWANAQVFRQKGPA